ncbi:hypothetical protein GGR53DRAFT_467812 [Hypoxylon sp. FL1150]|nr:hypothetical protein GGR53DRAFT_467812 [Hypoxylon sp. FL1150]
MPTVHERALEITGVLKAMTVSKIPVTRPLSHDKMRNRVMIAPVKAQYQVLYEKMRDACVTDPRSQEALVEACMVGLVMARMVLPENMWKARRESEEVPLEEYERTAAPWIIFYDETADLVNENSQLPLNRQWSFLVRIFRAIVRFFPRIIDEFAFWQKKTHDDLHYAIYDIFGHVHHDVLFRYPGQGPCESFLNWVYKLVLHAFDDRNPRPHIPKPRAPRAEVIQADKERKNLVVDALEAWSELSGAAFKKRRMATPGWPEGDGDKVGDELIPYLESKNVGDVYEDYVSRALPSYYTMDF